MILFKDNVERMAEDKDAIKRLKEKGFRPAYIPKPVTAQPDSTEAPKPATEPVKTFRKRPARRTKAEV